LRTGDSSLPLVTIHYAQTLDGRIATCTGQSQWVSGDASLELAHRLRASHEAIMVGVGTVIADNPRLTVRLTEGRSPRRIILDSRLRLPLDSLVLTDGAAETLVATTIGAHPERVRALCETGAEILMVSQDAQGRVDLSELLCRLGALGIASVLIEGGRGIITSALRGRLFSRLVICIAPKIIGKGVEAVGDLNIRSLTDALTFARTTYTPLGGDIIFDGELQPAYQLQHR